MSAGDESEFERQLAGILAIRLQTLRLAKGLTQWDVADRAGIARNHYQLLESGWVNRRTKSPSNPRLSTLVAVSEVLGTIVPELIDEMFARDSAG
ncbi:helix-turn-helix domain-containing protein [Tsukamurella soli]|uniref:HTH cro/C1-type domain-containing protein n=1 Tax=Tsukamurella soli TaxID=644556 RepID=A0ABP8KC06_9ACTN